MGEHGVPRWVSTESLTGFRKRGVNIGTQTLDGGVRSGADVPGTLDDTEAVVYTMWVEQGGEGVSS